MTSCKDSENEKPISNPKDDLIVTNKVLESSFVGNGVQWGGYDVLESWTGSSTLSDSDWEKLFERVKFMRPPLVRIMTSPGWNYLVNGEFNPAKSEPVLFKILDFCEAEGIAVMFGEWGHSGGDNIDQAWLENAASFLDWLLTTRNYTCIRYYNLVNEPNGDWSSINGNYDLWRNLQEQFHAKLVEKKLDDRIGLIGPDVAVWGTDLTWWVSNTYAHLDDLMLAYDIHTYPSESVVREGAYFEMVRAYRNSAPLNKPMIMGELGFKYSSDSPLGKENAKRIKEDPYASDDSNMFIYDAFYGIDMADALIQNMLAGYAGTIIWGLDDAQYNIDGGGSTQLKRWGFWNILGEEKFESADDENIRPWFYPMSLLTRFFPVGSKIYEVQLPAKRGLRAIAAEKDGQYTIAIVNSHVVDYTVNLKMSLKPDRYKMNYYLYESLEGSEFVGKIDNKGFPLPTEVDYEMNFEDMESIKLSIKGQSFHLFTNMK